MGFEATIFVSNYKFNKDRQNRFHKVIFHIPFKKALFLRTKYQLKMNNLYLTLFKEPYNVEFLNIYNYLPIIVNVLYPKSSLSYLAVPKSIICKYPFASTTEFYGFRSRYTIFLECKNYMHYIRQAI